jgi:hypothetical protein
MAETAQARSGSRYLKAANRWASELSKRTSLSRGMTTTEIDERQSYNYRLYESITRRRR